MSFHFEPLEITGVVLVRPTRHVDARGWLSETYRASAFRAAGLPDTFVQHNLVRSSKGVLRGLHFQAPPAAQGKLVGVVEGAIYDVAVDLRRGERTFGRWVARRLDAGSGASLWIPPGFAHGYQVLTESALVAYAATSEFRPELDRGFRWDDPQVGITWPLPDPVLSDRDSGLRALAEIGSPFHG